jgi:S-adenosylmethionine-diacylglycerol 3-amino-3-carboxypropyl transferase
LSSEIENRASFGHIRYAQCWEDADILVEALAIQPGDHCVSVASAGDNAFAMLAFGPKKLIAADLSPAQLACVALRAAAYERLEHNELLELIGSRPSERRPALYQRCRPRLNADAAAFWDHHPQSIAEGIGSAGKFERYFRLFRERVLPLIHSRRDVLGLLEARSPQARRDYYSQSWDTWRWRLLFRVFFSRFVMGRMGRDPEFFRYVEGSVSDRILERTRYALAELDPAANPYIHWILTGTHGNALPFALRKENFDAIRNNLGALELRLGPVEEVATSGSIHRWNLSDIFEYMSPDGFHKTLHQLHAASAPAARLVYWNMLAPRRRPDPMSHLLASHDEVAARLFRQDKAFFYSAFIIEEKL